MVPGHDPVRQVAAVRTPGHTETGRIRQPLGGEGVDAGQDVAHRTVTPVAEVRGVERLAGALRTARVRVPDPDPGPGEDLELPARREVVERVRSAMDLGLLPPPGRIDDLHVRQLCRRGAQVRDPAALAGRSLVESRDVVATLGETLERTVVDGDPPELVRAVDRRAERDMRRPLGGGGDAAKGTGYDWTHMTDQLSLHLDPALPRLPVSLRPMLARTAAAPFDSTEHLFEPAWSGERALAFVEPDPELPPDRRTGVRLLDSRGRDITPLVPEVAVLPARLAARSAVLDGELVAVDRRGRADRPALAARLADGPGPPIAYLVFDLLYLDGRPLLGLHLKRRRELLDRLLRPGDTIVAVPAISGDGRALHAAAVAQGIAGVVARHRRSPYLPGVRSQLWRFIPAAPDTSPGEAEPVPPAAAPVLALIERLPFPDE